MYPPMPTNPLLRFSPESMMNRAQFPGGVIPTPRMPSFSKVKGPSFMDRLGETLMPGQEVEGLISPEDIAAARSQGMLDIGLSLLESSGPTTADKKVGLMQAIGRGIAAGKGGFQDAVSSAAQLRHAGLQQKKLGQEVEAGEMGLEQAKNIPAMRKKILDAYPLPKDKAGLADWITQTLPHWLANDMETANELLRLMSSGHLGSQGQKNIHYMQTPGPDGKPRTIAVTPDMIPEGGIPTYERPQRDTEDALTMNSRLQGEERIVSNYLKRVDDVKATADAYVGATNAAQMGGAGDLQILYSFIRALDPASVVREGEIALARQAASLYSQAHILKNKFEKEGGNLSPIQRQQMLELMKQMVELKKDRVDLYRRDARSRLDRFGLTAELYDPLENYRTMQQRPSMTGVQGGSSSTATSPGDVMFPKRSR